MAITFFLCSEQELIKEFKIGGKHLWTQGHTTPEIVLVRLRLNGQRLFLPNNSSMHFTRIARAETVVQNTICNFALTKCVAFTNYWVN